MAFQHFRFNSALPHPPQVSHCAFGTGQQDEIRPSQLSALCHIAQGNAGDSSQCFKICKVGNPGKANHRQIQQRLLLCRVPQQFFRKAVLFF